MRTVLLLILLGIGPLLKAQVYYSEDFETSSANDWIPYPYAYTDNPCGNTAASFNLYSGDPIWLFQSPQVGTAIGGEIILNYDYVLRDYGTQAATSNSTNWGQIAVQWSQDEDNWTTLRTIDSTNHIESAGCATLADTFMPSAGPLFIRFLAIHNSGDYVLSVDNIALEEFTGPCSGTPTPGATIANTVLACPASPLLLSLQNTPTTFGMTYQWEVSADGTSWSNAPGTSNKKTYATIQTAPMNYRAQVTCDGASTAVSTPVFIGMTSDIAGCYCTPSNGDCSFGDSITNVTFAGINHSSGCSSGGYEDYRATDTAALTASFSYQMDVTVGDGGNENASVWIDFNQNGAFDEDEYYFIDYGNNETLSGSIAVPADAHTGLTRMRVGVVYLFPFDPDESCATNYEGEYEDYMVNISGVSDCTGQPSPGATLSDTASVTCSGDVYFSLETPPTGAGITYQWEVSLDGSNWDPIPGATVRDLTATVSVASQYRAQVTCTASAESAYSTPVSITIDNPSTGTLQAGPDLVCNGEEVLAAVEFTYPNDIVEYAWYSSTDGGNNFSPTGDTQPFIVTTPTEDIIYYATVVCIGGGTPVASAPVSITVGKQAFPQTFDNAAAHPDDMPCGWSRNSGAILGADANGYAVASGPIGSIRFNFYDSDAGSIIDLQTHHFDPAGPAAQLAFDYAYATYNDEVDSLEILVSADSGSTFAHLAGYGGGVNGTLTTAPPNTDNYVPSTDAEWGTKRIPLPAGTTTLLFRGHSAFGNDLFLDNINVCEATAPSLAITQSTTNACKNLPITFTASGQNLGTAPVYHWYRGGVELTGETDSTYTTSTISDQIAEDIQASVTGIDGCTTAPSVTSSILSVQAVPAPKPNVIITDGRKTLCDGQMQTVSFAIATTNAAGGVLNPDPLTYQWNVGGVAVNGATNGNYTTGDNGVVSLTVQSTVTGCTRTSGDYPVTTIPTPTATIAALGATAICPGSSVTLEASNVTSGASIRWKQDNDLRGVTTTQVAKTAGNYSLTVVLSGCSYTTPAIPVSVKNADLTVTASGPTTVCSPNNVILSAVSNADYSYTWYRSSAIVGGGSSYNAATSGSYRVGISYGGCAEKKGEYTTVTVNTTPVASISKIANGYAYNTLRANPSGTGIAYQWYKSGVAIDTATGRDYKATASGSYTVKVSKGGCFDSTATGYTVLLGSGAKFEEIASTEAALINVYPNPSEGIFNIGSEQPVNVMVKDIQGRIILDVRNASSADLSGQAAGIYMMLISDLDGKLLQAERIMKQ